MEGDDNPHGGCNGCHGDDVTCNWDLEVMQFLIDSFICMFPAQQCCECGCECCVGKEENCHYGSENSGPGAPNRPSTENNQEVDLDKKYSFDVHYEDEDDILESSADAFGCNFCHSMGS